MSAKSKKDVGSLVSGLQSSASGLTRLQRLAGSERPAERLKVVPVNRPSANDAEAGFQAYEPNSVYEPGDRVMLPLQLIVENPLNPRAFFGETALQALVNSIVQAGLQTAIQVYPRNENGEYVLKSGHRRVRAMKVLGQPVIKAEVVAHSGDPLRDYREAREINREHKSHTHIDDAVRFQQLLAEGVVAEQRQLAEMLGVTDADVSKHLSIATLPRDALQQMAEYPAQCGFTASYLLYRYWATAGNDDEALLKLVKRVTEGKVSTRQLEQLVSAQKAPQGEKRREHAFSRAELGGFARGELKAFDGKLTLKLENMPNEKRDALFRSLLSVFEDAGLNVGGVSREPGAARSAEAGAT